MKKGFIFDLNKCVGCEACVVACQIENSKVHNQQWRAVNAFNPLHHPDLPLFHYSLACNHCEDAPCMKGCPALAFTKERGLEGIQTIAHLSDRCIGCKYCTWTCPYDAPKFIPEEGVVEKCTLCSDRLNAGLTPACANHCPTGALGFGAIDTLRTHRNPCFAELNIKPGIELIPLRNPSGPEHHQKMTQEEQAHFQSISKNLPSKISLRNEWTLVLFTLLAALLTSMMADYAIGTSTGSPFLFAAIGLAGMALSSFHLGKKFRAWRAVLNLRHSWLSREIFFYSAFIGFSTYALFFPDQKFMAFLAALLGFATLFSIDKVYGFIQKTTVLNIHSANVFLSGMLLTACLLTSFRWVIFLLTLKLALYLYRKITFYLRRKALYPLLSVLRIGLGILCPLYLLIFSSPFLTGVLIGLVLAGELIDRSEFYMDLEVPTPKQQLATDLKALQKSKFHGFL